VLDTDARVLLPEEGAVPALERVIALHQAQDMLDRDVAVVDMRLGDRPTLRVGPAAMALMRPELAQAAAAAAN
jgi:cell division protein FtsQ